MKQRLFKITPFKACVSILLFVGILLHLIGLSHPNSVVFDEVHFGKFISGYCCTGERFFDIHPPHAKLLIAGVAKLGGYKGDFGFDNINKPYENVPTYWLRLVPALSGILIPIALFVLIGQLGGSIWAAFLGAIFVLFDNALVIQTRIIALDGLLLLSSLASLSLFLLATQLKHPTKRVVTFLLAGGFAGFAVGTKFTGLAVLGLLGLMLLVKMVRGRNWKNVFYWFRQSLWVGAGACAVYLAGWVLHFNLLSLPGAGDRYYKPISSFATDTVMMHKSMFGSNYNLKKTHPYSSPWWSWPLMKKPVFYASANGSRVYFLGNPVVWWGITLMLLVVMTNLALFRVTNLSSFKMKKDHLIWIPLVAYVASYAPYVGVPRVLFMYHYLPPLLFSVMVVLLWLDAVGWIRPGGFLRQRVSYHLTLVFVIFGFFLISPYTYGFKVKNSPQTKALEFFIKSP